MIGEHLAWDSAFFGETIGRLARPLESDQDARAFRAWMTAHDVACAYCLVDAGATAEAHRLEMLGARLVDLRLTYTLSLTPGQHAEDHASPRARLASASDAEALVAIAARAHVDSRFYADPRFSPERADELYRTWIRRSVEHAFADGVVTIDHDGAAAGYVTFSGPARTRTEGVGEIGLVAMAARARGLGYGPRLLRAALDQLAELGVNRVRVVTQGRNIAAQRLYQRAGFVTESVALWFHLWSGADGASIATSPRIE